MMRVVSVLRYAKKAPATSNIEIIKSIALAAIEICLTKTMKGVVKLVSVPFCEKFQTTVIPNPYRTVYNTQYCLYTV